MKRAVVFLSFILLLGVGLISGTSNIAFAGRGDWTPSTPEAVILYCTENTSTSPPSFGVTAVSNTTSVTITLPADCAATLVALKGAGLVIRDAHVLNTSPVTIVYTLVNGPME